MALQAAMAAQMLGAPLKALWSPGRRPGGSGQRATTSGTGERTERAAWLGAVACARERRSRGGCRAWRLALRRPCRGMPARRIACSRLGCIVSLVLQLRACPLARPAPRAGRAARRAARPARRAGAGRPLAAMQMDDAATASLTAERSRLINKEVRLGG